MDVEAYAARLNRSAAKAVAQRTRSKIVPSVAKSSSSVQNLSSETSESPGTEKGIEASSSRNYAKGIRKFFSLLSLFLMSMLLSIALLTSLEPFRLVVEFKSPVLPPMLSTSRELFAKRVRDDKAIETNFPKSPSMPLSKLSPDHKKSKTSPSGVMAKTGPSVPRILQEYKPHVNPSEFSHQLDDLLLSQYVEASEGKKLDVVLDEVPGYVFHVSVSSAFLHIFIFLSAS